MGFKAQRLLSGLSVIHTKAVLKSLVTMVLLCFFSKSAEAHKMDCSESLSSKNEYFESGFRFSNYKEDRLVPFEDISNYSVKVFSRATGMEIGQRAKGQVSYKGPSAPEYLSQTHQEKGKFTIEKVKDPTLKDFIETFIQIGVENGRRARLHSEEKIDVYLKFQELASFVKKGEYSEANKLLLVIEKQLDETRSIPFDNLTSLQEIDDQLEWPNYSRPVNINELLDFFVDFLSENFSSPSLQKKEARSAMYEILMTAMMNGIRTKSDLTEVDGIETSDYGLSGVVAMLKIDLLILQAKEDREVEAHLVGVIEELLEAFEMRYNFKASPKEGLGLGA